MEWVDFSLELEYGVLAALLISDENLSVSNKTINELAELIAFATQDYSSYSVELGVMPMHVTKTEKEYVIPEEDSVSQRLLADSGLEDWGKDVDKVHFQCMTGYGYDLY